MADVGPVVQFVNGGNPGDPGTIESFFQAPSLDFPLPDIQITQPGSTAPSLFDLTKLGALGAEVLLAAAGAIIPGSAPLSQQHAPEADPLGAAAPPAGGTGVGVAASPEIPFNWWDIGQGGNPDVLSQATGPAPSVTGGLGELLARLLDPSQLGDIGATPTPSDPSRLLEPFVPTDIPRAPTDTVFVTASVPTGDPLVVPDPVLAPVEVHPGDVPEIPPPAIDPFNPLAAPDVGSGPRFSVGFGRQVGTVIVSHVAPVLASRGVVPSGGVVRPIVSPLVGVGGIIGDPIVVPVSGIIGDPIVVPVIEPIVPVGFIGPVPAPPDTLTQTETQAQMLTAANQCTTTQQQQRRKKKQARTKCYRGTYEDLSHGLLKFKKEQIPCR